MQKDLTALKQILVDILQTHDEVFKVVEDSDAKYEVSGTVPAMQGKKKVDGIYFASVVPKPKDVRFYFFPLYTHREKLIDTLSDELKKALKGKTCFHIKALSDKGESELKALVAQAVKLYQADGLLA